MKTLNRKEFFAQYKNTLDPNKSLSEAEVEALDIFLNMFEKNMNFFTIPQWAYVFATVIHETGFTFEPLRESPRASETWRKAHFRYFPYYGRGFVQLTWESNYKKYSQKLGIDLVKNPDLAMKPEIAFFILIDGFKFGVFTGKKISDYISADKKDYKNARKCINILDKADTIAAYTKSFEVIFNKTITGC